MPNESLLHKAVRIACEAHAGLEAGHRRTVANLRERQKALAEELAEVTRQLNLLGANDGQ